MLNTHLICLKIGYTQSHILSTLSKDTLNTYSHKKIDLS